MQKQLICLLVGLMALLPAGLKAQALKVVHWAYSVQKVSETEYDLVFTATVDKGWHLYSQFIGEGGPVPTSFTFKESKEFTLVDKVKELSHAEKIHDVGFDMDLTYFSGEAVFVQRIKTQKPPKKIGGTLEFMACDDSKCLPPERMEFEFDMKKCADAQQPKK